MSDQGNVERHIVIKQKKDEGKVKRWIVNPVVKLAKWDMNDPKKDRVSA